MNPRICLAMSIVCWCILAAAQQSKTVQPAAKAMKRQTASLSEMLGAKALPPSTAARSLESMAMKPPVPNDDAVFWDAPLEILYGATFTLAEADDDDESHTVSADEVYEIVETTVAQPFTILGYCEHSDGGVCALREIGGGQIRMKYRFRLQPKQYHTRGLHEVLTFPSRLVWLLLEDGKGNRRWRLLNLFHGLQDLYSQSDKANMTTLILPKNTFLSLDGSTLEQNPNFDIIHYPRQFQSKLLDTDSYLTRVNPNTPLPIRWAVQQLISAGIASVFWHWILVGLGGLTPLPVLTWIFQRLFRSGKPEAKDKKPKAEEPKADEGKAAAATA